MIAVTKLHPDFAERCHELPEGETAYATRAEIPYDVHHYRDGWYALWKSPPNGQLGRRLRTHKELAAFLQGDPSVGLALPTRRLRAK